MLKTFTLSLTLAMTAMIGMPSQGGEPTCGGEAQNAACCDSLCPRCGCRLVPVCHTYCTTKKVTEYKYVCACEAICIPGVTPVCKKCRSCENVRRVRRPRRHLQQRLPRGLRGTVLGSRGTQAGKVPGNEGSAGPKMHGGMGLPAMQLPLQLKIQTERLSSRCLATLTVCPSVSSLRSPMMTSSLPVTLDPGIADLHFIDLDPCSVANAHLGRGLDGLVVLQEITVGLIARHR